MGDAITSMVMNDVNAFRNAEYKGKAKKLVEPVLRRKSSQ